MARIGVGLVGGVEELMALYEFTFMDDLTEDTYYISHFGDHGQEGAEREARARLEITRKRPPGYAEKELVPLRLTGYLRSPNQAAYTALFNRVGKEGRGDQYEAFRTKANKRLLAEHPKWSPHQRLKEMWRLAFELFPPMDPRTSFAAREAKEIKQDGTDERAREALLSRALTKSDRGEIQEDVDWVYQSLEIAWNQIPVDNVPSPGAVGLLLQAKSDKKWFLEKYHARLLPTKAKIESGGGSMGDDSQIAEMCARIIEDAALEEVEV